MASEDNKEQTRIGGKPTPVGQSRGSTMGVGGTPFYLPTKAEEVLGRLLKPLRILYQTFNIADPVLWISSDYRIGCMLGVVIRISSYEITVYYGDGVERIFDIRRNPNDPRILDASSVATGIQVLYNLKECNIDYRRGDRVITNVFIDRALGTVIRVLPEENYGKALEVLLDTGVTINVPMNYTVMCNEGFAIAQVQSRYNS